MSGSSASYGASATFSSSLLASDSRFEFRHSLLAMIEARQFKLALFVCGALLASAEILDEDARFILKTVESARRNRYAEVTDN